MEQKEILEDPNLYELFKDTWLGERVSILANLSRDFKNKQHQAEIDLSNLMLL